MRHFFLLLSTLLLLTGCLSSEGDKAARQTAERWARAYFNCDFQKAMDYTVAEDGRWLRFAASNMTEGDVELLNGREEAAAVEVTDLYMGNDSMATAMVSVSSWLRTDTIGQAGRLSSDGVFAVDLVKRGGRWLVRMAGLPQSERQSPDSDSDE